jgi:hypothetical protein
MKLVNETVLADAQANELEIYLWDFFAAKDGDLPQRSPDRRRDHRRRSGRACDPQQLVVSSVEAGGPTPVLALRARPVVGVTTRSASMYQLWQPLAQTVVARRSWISRS